MSQLYKKAKTNTNGVSRQRDPVGRVFRVLRFMVGQPQRQFGVREVATACSMQLGTVHRALRSLVNEGLVEHTNENDSYRVGIELVRLGFQTSEKIDLKRVSRPVLRETANAFNETVLLGLYNSRTRCMSRIDYIESGHPLRYYFELYQWTEIYRGASGLAILANLSVTEQEIVLREAEEDPTVTWDGRAAAIAELNAIKNQGYALTHGRRVQGAVGVASPIFDFRNDVVGDLIVTVPEQRFDDVVSHRLTTWVASAAEEISKNMGFSTNSDESMVRY